MKNNEENERSCAEQADVMIISQKVIGWWNLIKSAITRTIMFPSLENLTCGLNENNNFDFHEKKKKNLCVHLVSMPITGNIILFLGTVLWIM